jgi:GNAT superfamily N-acetyltransferase
VSGDLVIRRARPDDAPRIHDLHTISVRTLCSGHYTAGVIEGWLLNRAPAAYLAEIERGELFVAEREGRVVGFGAATAGTVVAVYVDPAAVLHGVGRALLHHAVALARRGHLGPVRLQATLNAHDFYAREGFREIERGVTRRNDVEIPVIVMEYDAGAR